MRTLNYLFLFLFLSLTVGSFAQDKIDLLILNKNYEEALNLINKKIEKQATAKLYFKKGIINKSMQNYQGALEAFSAGYQLEPNNTEILGEMAENLAILGNYYDASPFFERVKQLDPNNLTIIAKLGKNYINLDDYRKAFDVFSEIYAKDSTNLYWNKQMAYCAFQTGRKKLATSLYEKIIDENPGDYGSYFNLLRLYNRKEQLDQFLSLIDKGMEQFPGNSGFYRELAGYHFANKQYEEAKENLENYFKANGDSTYKIMLNYGICCYFAKDEKLAISVLTKCERLNANDPYVLFYLSLSNKRLAEYDLAEKFMTLAIDFSIPGYLSEMYHHLGQIHGQKREFEESIAALKKSAEYDPTNYEVLFEIATTYEEYNSNKTLALNYYRIYLKEAGEKAKNVNYALDRIKRIKEDLFFDE
jgi:tetratricopeptide (TPR) repeat protein